MSLRARLLLVLLSLVSVSVLVADVATYTALRSFLNERVDRQLDAAVDPLLRELLFGRPSISRFRPGPGGPGRGDHDQSILSGTYGELRDDTGRVIGTPATLGDGDIPRPLLPPVIEASRGTTFTVGSVGGDLSYRVRTTALSGGVTLVAAVPLNELAQTLARLVRIEVLVTVGVLAALAGTSWWLVRLGLRPLEEIGETASHIAAGDLSRRVSRAEPRTEVGRLGLALNAMLAQIEKAFAERTESENRLRRFLADASHELRTPLTSIRGYAELFRRGAGARPDDLAKAMSRIEQESTRMGVLVDDLLLLARIDQGRPLEFEPIDLTAIAADAVHDARAIDPSRTIALAAPGPVTILGDETSLRQVAANLLSNALRHTPEGSPIDVRLSFDASDACLEVTDHGRGLEPGDAERVFERFYRSDPSRVRATGGAGLGLSIVSAIVDAHGGRVHVESEPGRGATFRVFLRLARFDHPADGNIDG